MRFVYHMKISENLCFSVVFKWYRKRPMTWNGLLEMKNFEFTLINFNYRKNCFKKRTGCGFISRKCSNFPLIFYFSCSHSSNTYVEIKDSKEDRVLGIYCRSEETVVSASNEVTVKFINKEPSSKKGMQLYFKMGNISYKTD